MRTKLFLWLGWAGLFLGGAPFSVAGEVDVPMERFSDPPRPSAEARAKAEKLKLAVAQNPESAEAWTNFGWRLYKDGRYGECEWIMGEARQRQPDDAYILWLSGLASYAMGNYPAAKEHLWKMWMEHKTWPETVDMAVTYDILGRVALHNDDLFQACYFFGKSADEAPKNWQVHFLLGFAEWYRQRYGDAAEALGKAHALHPKHPLVLQYYAWARVAVDEREMVYTKEGAEKESWPEAALDAEKARERYQDDLGWIRQAIETNPAEPDNWELLGRYHTSLGNRPEAIQAFRHAMAMDERDASSRYLLAKLLLATEVPEDRVEAKRLLLESLAISPGYWEGNRLAPHAGVLISALIADDQRDEAQALAEWVEAQNAEEPRP